MGNLRIIELFSGIGTQHEALKRIGIPHIVVGVSEIDKYADRAYTLLHGEHTNFGDITKIEKLPNVDLWFYSFPCTDLSTAGEMKGFKGEHSSLLYEVKRLLETSEFPKYLVMENVKSINSYRFQNEYLKWQEYLQAKGYKNYSYVYKASDYGIPQEREREILVSIRSDLNKYYVIPEPIPLKVKVKDLLEDNVNKKYYLSEKLIKCMKRGKLGNCFRPYRKNERDIAYTITTKVGTRRFDNFIIDDIGIRRLTPRECWRLMGWYDEEIDKVINEFSDTQLYKMAGNAIVVNVLQAIFTQLFIGNQNKQKNLFEMLLTK